MLSLANGSLFERATYPMIPPPGPAPLTIPLVHAEEQVEPGIGLSLSGGGYRAMLFHVGSLWRLNEAGLLSQLQRISSISGGSITAGQLALA